MTTQAAFAQYVAPFQTTLQLQQAHVKAGLSVSDAALLDANPHQVGQTAAQAWEATHGTRYFGKHGHVSID